MAGKRICEYCRSEIPSGAAYCPHCGAEPVTPPPPVTPVTPATQPYAPPQAVQPGVSQSTTLSITAFVLALVGFAVGITLIPALIIGIIALKREPKGKTFAWIAIGISGVILLIIVVLIITTLLQIAAAPRPWY